MSARRPNPAVALLRRLVGSAPLRLLEEIARGGMVLPIRLPPGLAQFFRSARARQDSELDRQIVESRRRRGGRPRSLTAEQVAAHQDAFARALAADQKLRVRKNAESFATKKLGVKAGTAWNFIIKPVYEREGF